jgi:hypothetical protein
MKKLFTKQPGMLRNKTEKIKFILNNNLIAVIIITIIIFISNTIVSKSTKTPMKIMFLAHKNTHQPKKEFLELKKI